MATRIVQDESASTRLSLAEQTGRGFVWMVAQTLGTKIIQVVGQLILAWLLAPTDFGLIGLAYTVSVFAALVQQSGLSEILILRHARSSRWVNPIFWMSLTLGFLSALLMAVAAPVAGAVYHSPGVRGLVWIMALVPPLSALSIVPMALLRGRLKFRVVCLTEIAAIAATMGLTIALAGAGFGAYSFVIPLPIVAGIQAAALWLLSSPGVRIRGRADIRLWKFLWRDSALLYVSSVFNTVVWQGDYAILGILQSTQVVGIYYFAFALSTQSFSLLTQSLSSVLFPVLTQIRDDPKRQRLAFVRAARALAVVAVPVCLLQAALAAPLIHVLFPSKWEGAIPLVQILSLGAAMRVIGSAAGSLMQAQRLFGLKATLSVCYAFLFIILVFIGAWFGAAIGVAIAVAAFYILVSPITMYFTLYRSGGGWGDVLRVHAAAVPASIVAVGLGMLAGHFIPAVAGQEWMQIGVITSVAVVIYGCIVRVSARDTWNELLFHARQIYGQWRGALGVLTPKPSATGGRGSAR